MSRLLPLASAALLATACGGLDEIDFTRSGSATVPAGTAALPAGSFATFPFSIGRDALAEQGIEPNDVDSARVVALRLDATAGTPLQGWLDRVAIYVEAEGLPRVLVGERGGIRALPAGTAAVDLDVSGADLKPYALAPTTVIVAEGEGELPPAATTVEATMTIRVDVNVSGLFD